VAQLFELKLTFVVFVDKVAKVIDFALEVEDETMEK